MRKARASCIVISVAALELGCAARRPPSNARSSAPDRPAVPALTSAEVAAPNGGVHATVGSELTVSLEDELGSYASSEGQTFTAKVETELRAPDGTLVVPVGARVSGEVKLARHGKAPLLALDFVSVETTLGDAPISTMLHGATHLHLPSVEQVYDPAASPYDALFSARQVPGPIGYAAPASGTYGKDYYDEHDEVIRLPAGARLRLMLTRPLALPPARP